MILSFSFRKPLEKKSERNLIILCQQRMLWTKEKMPLKGKFDILIPLKYLWNGRYFISSKSKQKINDGCHKILINFLWSIIIIFFCNMHVKMTREEYAFNCDLLNNTLIILFKFALHYDTNICRISYIILKSKFHMVAKHV